MNISSIYISQLIARCRERRCARTRELSFERISLEGISSVVFLNARGIMLSKCS